MKYYTFENGVNENELFYAYSPQSKTSNKFEVKNGFLVNNEMPIPDGAIRTYGDYEHISLLTKQAYGVGTTVTVECDFDVFGAPLLVLTNDLITVHDKPSYDRHIEVVAYEKGINVWDIVYAPDKPERRYIMPKKIAHKEFSIEGGERIFITTKILNGCLEIVVNGEELKVEIPDLPTPCYVGFTACEGINRLYSLKVEE